MKNKLFFSVYCLLLIGSLSAQRGDGVVKATLNGINLVFDAESGSILSMSSPATGLILQAKKDSAGIVDLAYPVKEFEPLRLASRYSTHAQIIKGNGTVTIHWDELGASRSFNWYKGKVSATVILKEEPDGKSISLSCKIENHSDHTVPQIIFPDFSGFLPFNGKTGTEFRTGGTAIKPFVDMVVSEHDQFYGMNESMRWFHYGFVLDGKNLVIKWMDIGGRKSGLSIFSKDWGINNGYEEGVMLQLSEISGKLRYMKTLNADIAPDNSWQSPEYILTPHANGWAEGIIPYRQWANQHIKRLYPLPGHVRDGLGYQTLWMRNFFYPEDPEGNNFTFKDLPKAARDAKENGLDEMVLWGWWKEPFTLPLLPVNRFLGSQEDLVNAVAECKKIGVNVAPFRSVMIANPSSVGNYGVEANTEYNYDPEFLPMLNPRYAVAGKGAAIIPSSNKKWQQAVLSSTKSLIDLGIPSISWDQYFNVGPGRYLDTIVTEIRRIAKEKDPQSTFSGEAGTNMENECDYLDYTWNWDYNDKCDYRALISSLQGPRINVNIDRSVAEAKIGFADNLYLNVYPRKVDGVNGSDYISNHPELSKTLKQCARLRKQFLDYFVNGTFIGDCILSKDCNGAHVSAYALPKSMLVIVINEKEKRPIRLQGTISPWLKSATGRYKVKEYNDGIPAKTIITTGSQWNQQTPVMKNLDICMYEITAE
ncbi:MAG: hypothetical protein WDO19_15435 [Bacteroidota bacterium]